MDDVDGALTGGSAPMLSSSPGTGSASTVAASASAATSATACAALPGDNPEQAAEQLLLPHTAAMAAAVAAAGDGGDVSGIAITAVREAAAAFNSPFVGAYRAPEIRSGLR